MKYKQKYLEQQEEIRSLMHDLNRERNGRIEAEAEARAYKESMSHFEGRESDLRTENEWLKTTLRLVVVDAEKITNLKEQLEKDPMSMRIKF